jgi:hypothetical protein
MSALSDIAREIDRHLALCEREAGQPFSPAAKRYARAHQMQVHVGKSAERSILATTGDERLPHSIDDVPLVRTEAFDGFELVLL